ncbi:MAG TPA: transcriptional regulator [Kutzneria sp.]|jgi:DNA-binding MarR family transcriptional regulator
MLGLDPHLHAPARLKLMSMLIAVSEMEFSTLREELEVSDSVLSKHIAALVDVDYVRSRKGSHLGRRTTWVSTTRSGRSALSAHVAALRAIIADVD